jgi:hypothetical protein
VFSSCTFTPPEVKFMAEITSASDPKNGVPGFGLMNGRASSGNCPLVAVNELAACPRKNSRASIPRQANRKK